MADVVGGGVVVGVVVVASLSARFEFGSAELVSVVVVVVTGAVVVVSFVDGGEVVVLLVVVQSAINRAAARTTGAQRKCGLMGTPQSYQLSVLGCVVIEGLVLLPETAQAFVAATAPAVEVRSEIHHEQRVLGSFGPGVDRGLDHRVPGPTRQRPGPAPPEHGSPGEGVYQRDGNPLQWHL